MRVIVIGGGFSGMAAACRLANDGHRVTVLEAASRLGGRAASFVWQGETIDYGQHVLLRACTAAQGFLERIGAAEAVRFQESLAVPLLCDGRRSVLRSAPLPGAAHLLPGLLAYRHLTLGERLGVVLGGLALLVVRGRRRDDEAFGAWLRRHGQGERAIRRLWEPVVVAALNASTSAVSLRAARHLFDRAFFAPGGADVGLFREPLGSVFLAARRYLEERGGEVRLGARVDGLLRQGGRARGVRLSHGERIEADGVIATVPPDALSQIAGDVPELAGTVERARRLEWAPIVNVRLTFDQTVLDDPFAVAVDSAVQVVFAQETSGRQTLVLSQSAASRWVDLSDHEIVGSLEAALRELLPRACGAARVESLVLRHRRATFVPAPGSDALRPKARTTVPGLCLAGDWTATGWPSTIEGAVLSGVHAAAALVSDAASVDPPDAP